MYKILRRILFLFPTEWVHYFSMNCLKLICQFGFIKRWITVAYRPGKGNEFSLFNLRFSNRIGLGAGFDKNARYLRELACLGFGFVEIGTVTPLPQAGNPRPRLFRLPHDKALINRMGFNNDGVKLVTEKLRQWKNLYTKSGSPGQSIIIGGNIGKNKSTANEDAWKDYAICFTELHPYVDYFVVNVSSPNTPGLRELQEKESLRKILSNLQTINSTQVERRPILLKIAPDLHQQQVDDVVDLAKEIGLDGLVVSNTTISREGLVTSKERLEAIGAGGLSGMPLRHQSTMLVNYIRQRTEGKIPIIASGGIFTGEDAKEKFEAGASLVQVWTGFIYEGPGIVRKIDKAMGPN